MQFGGEKLGQIFSRKSVGKRPLEKCRHRWEDNTKTDLKEIGCERVDWTQMGQDRVH
jgi:hypothetical protein